MTSRFLVALCALCEKGLTEDDRSFLNPGTIEGHVCAECEVTSACRPLCTNCNDVVLLARDEGVANGDGTWVCVPCDALVDDTKAGAA